MRYYNCAKGPKQKAHSEHKESGNERSCLVLKREKKERTTGPVFAFMGITALLAGISGVFRVLEANYGEGPIEP